ncbi:multidrug effflux MFS transporter [Nocardiopsis metallicus]|uniref:DHA1 family bicyclomycin/chloramphenicol resistance-like MFS transporter n=1 Tax=Nocardiopsis metallicus TaxID=179819 RepID=A0A840WC86_9ACTN|nr:DHA1 family bicyclomycin/chloramphenicol resistance-like MFS transporter [Nocardiopsis metallicus]
MSLTAVRSNARRNSPNDRNIQHDEHVRDNRGRNSGARVGTSPSRRSVAMLVLVLGVLSAIGPLATDLYLPALPEITADLGASEARVKLTLTAVMAGLALGQLVTGPLSDRWGRRLPLLVGTGVFTAVTFAIVFVSSAESFMALRFLQGLSAAAGLVVSRAVVRDVFHGDTAATFFSRLMLLTGLAPMLGPVLGGQLLLFGPWQLIFGVLGLTGAATFALVLFALPESLPREQRRRQDPRVLARTFGRLLRDPGFIAPTMVLALSFGMSFTYISAFSFVSQAEFGATAQQFSLIFGVTTLGMILGNQVNVVLIPRMELRRRLGLGLAGAVASVGGMGLLAAVGRADLVTVTAALFVMMVFTGLISPNATAMALSGQPPEIAGTSSALLGTLQFGVGSALAATAGLSGSTTLASMTAVMLATAVGAALVFLFAAVRGRAVNPAA